LTAVAAEGRFGAPRKSLEQADALSDHAPVPWVRERSSQFAGATNMGTVSTILKSKPDATVHHVGPGDTVFDVVQRMAQHNIGALLVTENDKVVGIVTERDYARKVVLLSRASKDTLVRDIMTSAVIGVQPEQSCEECMALMTENRLRHLPVMDRGKLVGLVSIGDLVKHIISEQKFVIDQLEHYITGHHDLSAGDSP
jgi:CBS domain-containing protein